MFEIVETGHLFNIKEIEKKVRYVKRSFTEKQLFRLKTNEELLKKVAGDEIDKKTMEYFHTLKMLKMDSLGFTWFVVDRLPILLIKENWGFREHIVITEDLKISDMRLHASGIFSIHYSIKKLRENIGEVIGLYRHDHSSGYLILKDESDEDRARKVIEKMDRYILSLFPEKEVIRNLAKKLKLIDKVGELL